MNPQNKEHYSDPAEFSCTKLTYHTARLFFPPSLKTHKIFLGPFQSKQKCGKYKDMFVGPDGARIHKWFVLTRTISNLLNWTHHSDNIENVVQSCRYDNHAGRIDVSYHNIHRKNWKRKNYKATSRLTAPKLKNPPWQAANLSADKEISQLLRNLNIHYRVRQTQPLVPIPRQMNPVRTLQQHFLTIDSCIIVTSMSGSHKLSHTLRFSNQNILQFSPCVFVLWQADPSVSNSCVDRRHYDGLC
jgi:hypothetical protein